jgi:hypothetical protein
MSTLLPRAWIPSLLFVPKGFQAGIYIPGFDVSQKHVYELFGGYDSRGLPFGSFAYRYRFARTYSWDINPYYLPSFLPSTYDTAVKRWGVNMGINGTLGFASLDWRLGVLYKKVDYSGPSDAIGGEVGLSRSFGFTKTGAPQSVPSGVKLSVNYQNFPKSLGTTNSYYNLVGTVDQTWAAPFWDRSALMIKTNVGLTEGARFVDSYYEAGGELLFSQSRGMFLNRGYEAGTFLARRVATLNVEYRFPLLTVERGYGLSPAFLNRISGALVGDGTSVDGRRKLLAKWYWSAGAEIKTQWKFFYYLPTELRVGVYHAFTPLVDNSQPNLTFVLGMEAGL